MFKRLLIIIALFSSPAWAAWTCQDGLSPCLSNVRRECGGAGGSSCDITVASTAAHSIEVACEQVNSTSLLTVSGDGTWITASNSSSGGTANGQCAYNLNATGGATTITCNFAPTSGSERCSYLNFTGTGTAIFDSASSVVDATCTGCAGVSLTLATSNNYLLVQSSFCAQTCSGIDQSYNLAGTSNGNGFAFKMNVSTAGATPQWTQAPTGQLWGGALAIYESVGRCVACELSLLHREQGLYRRQAQGF